MATIEELLSEVVQARREALVVKRDAEAQLAVKQTRNEELVEMIQELRAEIKQARAEAAKEKARADTVSQESDQHSRAADKAQATLKPALADLEAERAESASLRTRLVKIAQIAEGKDSDR